VSVNRTELVQAIAAKAGLTNTAADAALKAFQEVLVEQLSAGESVTIPGLLAVSRADRAARTGINPQTGEKLDIPAGFRVKLTAGSALKRAVAAN
jgi:DNA-binding protein HU-beta